MELIQLEQEKERRIKKEKKRKASLRVLWDNIWWTDIHVIGSQKEKRQMGRKLI